jgi:hypothetical protein
MSVTREYERTGGHSKQAQQRNFPFFLSFFRLSHVIAETRLTGIMDPGLVYRQSKKIFKMGFVD